MYIRQSMVDGAISSFSTWKRELEAEDVSECGCVIKRSDEELCRMYKTYVEFQSSAEVAAARVKRMREKVINFRFVKSE